MQSLATKSIETVGIERKNFFDLRKNLLSLEEVIDILESLKNDFDAIITHWLANTDAPPIGLKKDDAKKLKELAFGVHTAIEIEYPNTPIPPRKSGDFSFIDLFAGIGGFKIGLQRNKGKCLFSSEWNKAAKETYFSNYGIRPFGDIRNFTAENISDLTLDSLIPDHDVLAGGFPCQPFSRAGVSARTSLGQSHGFNCEIQGTLFFDIARIAKIKRPKIIFLENVMSLINHDKGRTFKTIQDTIEKDLGYSFSYKIINSETLVPQRRKRCYMVCIRDEEKKFVFPDFNGKALPLRSILEESPNEQYTISKKLWEGHKSRTARNIARGTGFTAGLANLDRPSNTIVARYGKDGKECLIEQKGKPPRMLTPRECARLQGFPENFKLPPYRTPAYRQFGNAVTVSVVNRIAEKIKEEL